MCWLKLPLVFVVRRRSRFLMLMLFVRLLGLLRRLMRSLRRLSSVTSILRVRPVALSRHPMMADRLPLMFLVTLRLLVALVCLCTWVLTRVIAPLLTCLLVLLLKRRLLRVIRTRRRRRFWMLCLLILVVRTARPAALGMLLNRCLSTACRPSAMTRSC